MTALALMSSVAIAAMVVLASRTQAPQATVPQAERALQIGITQGQSISSYVSTARGELDGMLDSSGSAEVKTYALVSLQAYLAPDRLTPVLAGASVVEVYLRVPLSQVQTEIVRIPVRRLPDDLLTGMRQVAGDNKAAADEYRSLAAAVSGTNTAQDLLRQTYLQAAQSAADEAAALLTGCSCVYAAVVHATSAALDQIAARPQVRAVDPAPEVLRLEEAVFLAPLPEQQDMAMPVPSALGEDP